MSGRTHDHDNPSDSVVKPGETQTNINVQDTTDSVATDRCSYTRIAKSVARAEMVNETFEEMIEMKIYTNEVTDIESQIIENFKFPKYDESNEISEVIMKKKLEDARRYLKKKRHEEFKMRKEIEKTHGRHTRITRSIMKRAREETQKLKISLKSKKEEKMMNLKRKSKRRKQNSEETKRRKETMGEYAEMKIFNSDNQDDEDKDEEENESDINEEKADSDEQGKSDVMVIGVELDVDEITAMRLPPKTSVLNHLDTDTFDLEVEICNAKIRYDMMKNPNE